MKGRAWVTLRGAILMAVLLVLGAPTWAMDGKVGLHLARMVPSGTDAERYSEPGWGGGLQLTIPMPQVANVLAGVVGIEAINLLSETTTTYDSQTLLRVEQQTNQYFGRLYLGP